MTYAWIPAAMCLIIVLASVPIYVSSPAISSGLAGLANLPLGFFITLRRVQDVVRREGHYYEWIRYAADEEWWGALNPT